MKYLQYIGIGLLFFLLPSCGEDRSGEFYALIENRVWIEEVMQENYLWYQEIPPVENENDYLKEPATFFKNMLYKKAFNGKGDRYSYLEEHPKSTEEGRSLMLDRTSTYGIEFELTNDPTQTTTHQFARVLYVLPESPAEQAGIRRGDWISAINKKRITTSNYTLLKQGAGLSVAREELVASEDRWTWIAKDTLQVGPSVTMEVNPFLVDSVYHIDGQKIAYLVYNEFATGPNNEPDESVYNEQMKQIFSQFRSESPDAFILDLRYNNGGYLQCAQALGSLIVPSDYAGDVFLNLEFNDKANPQIISYGFDPALASSSLQLDKIYILTSSYTASAAEAVIHGLIPYLGAENVILIGEKTEGKNVAMTPFENDAFGLTLWPVVAFVQNVNQDGNYSDGFSPTYPLNDRNEIRPWYPLGDEREFLLKNTLSLITTGSMPDIPQNETETMSILYRSIETKGFPGIRIN